MKNLYVVAILKIKENYLMDAIEILKKLVFLTRNEEGCLQYDLVEDIENKGTFFITELWETDEHHYLHGKSDHLLNFRESVAPMLEESIMVYKGFKTF